MSQTRLFMPRCACIALMLCASSVYAADTLDDAMASPAPAPMKPMSVLSRTSETVSTDDSTPMQQRMGSAHDKMTHKKMMPKKPMSHKAMHQHMMHDMPMSEKMSNKP